MSDKPKIYASCKSGCLWETVHKSDFLASAALVSLVAEDGLHILEQGKTYLITMESAWTFARVDVNIRTTAGNTVSHSSNNVLEYDKYSPKVKFRLCGIEWNNNSDSAGYTGQVVYEVNDERKYFAFEGDNVIQDATCEVVVYNPLGDTVPEVMLINEEAKIKAEDGKSAFIAYSANADGTDFTTTWSEGQTYMGFATALTAPTDKTGYTWHRIGANGNDYVLTKADKAEIAEMVDGATVVQAPKYVNSVDEMTDTSRVYVLSETGHIWAYMDTSVEKEITVTDTIENTVDNPYHDNTRLSSSATSFTDGFTTGATGYHLTPLIDLTKYSGKKIQLHLEGANYVNETAATYITHRTHKPDGSIVYVRGNTTTEAYYLGAWTTAEVTINSDTSTTIEIDTPLLYGSENVEIGYLRFCGKGAVADSHIYITYQGTQTVTGGQWVDTGTSYSPSLSAEDLNTVAEQAAAIVDNNLLSVIGSGEVSV